MDKYRQRILVVSGDGQGGKQLPDVDRDRFRFTYCAGDNQDVDIVDRSSPGYDWVLLDGGLMLGDQKDLFRSLRAMGFLFAEQGHCGQHGCKVEWTANGVLELQCCMPQRAAQSGAGAASKPVCEDSFVFEYHAPMKKTG